MKKDNILLVKEAAQLIGIEPATVYQWAHKQKRGWTGGCPVYKAGDGKLYLRRSEAEKYAAQFRPEKIVLPDYEDPDSPWADDVVAPEPKGGE